MALKIDENAKARAITGDKFHLKKPEVLYLKNPKDRLLLMTENVDQSFQEYPKDPQGIFGGRLPWPWETSDQKVSNKSGTGDQKEKNPAGDLQQHKMAYDYDKVLNNDLKKLEKNEQPSTHRASPMNKLYKIEVNQVTAHNISNNYQSTQRVDRQSEEEAFDD